MAILSNPIQPSIIQPSFTSSKKKPEPHPHPCLLREISHHLRLPRGKLEAALRPFLPRTFAPSQANLLYPVFLSKHDILQSKNFKHSEQEPTFLPDIFPALTSCELSVSRKPRKQNLLRLSPLTGGSSAKALLVVVSIQTLVWKFEPCSSQPPTSVRKKHSIHHITTGGQILCTIAFHY